MAMSSLERLTQIAKQQHGLVTTSDAERLGMDPANLRMLAHREHLERVGHGVYLVGALGRDRFTHYQQVLFEVGHSAVLSHATALRLHHLSDENPSRIHVTVPRTERVRRTLPPAVVIHRADLDPSDIMGIEGLPLTTPARSIIDGLADDLPIRFAEQAFHEARAARLIHGSDARAVRRALMLALDPTRPRRR